MADFDYLQGQEDAGNGPSTPEASTLRHENEILTKRLETAHIMVGAKVRRLPRCPIPPSAGRPVREGHWMSWAPRRHHCYFHGPHAIRARVVGGSPLTSPAALP